MRPLRIESALKLSISEVDGQHQELVNLLEQTQQVLDQDLPRVRLIRILDQFNELNIRHFATEELLMQEAGYPEFEAHKRMHDALIEKTFSFDATSLIDDESAGRELVALMREWLLSHMAEDREMGRYLKQNLLV
ncbi:MAG: hemerythrin family protein [Motiliproteus sp.]|nr:hemerythrin family protein [Motiliproteus sp.]MCW9053613.1 hemerythrin family protein [Motiliproteus sp.]